MNPLDHIPDDGAVDALCKAASDAAGKNRFRREAVCCNNCSSYYPDRVRVDPTIGFCVNNEYWVRPLSRCERFRRLPEHLPWERRLTIQEAGFRVRQAQPSK